MTGYPTLGFVLLQGLVTAVLLIAPWMLYAFVGGPRVGFADLGMILVTFPALAIVSDATFWLFEGDWFAHLLGPLAALRTLLVGGIALTAAMAYGQRRALPRPASELVVRHGATFLIGAAWGAVWGFSGWFLGTIGVAGNG